MSEERTILDHVEGYWVPSKLFEEHSNEFTALLWLKHGMTGLANQAKAIEQQLLQSVSHEDGQAKLRISGTKWVSADTTWMLTNFFHWYSISACQLVKTVGAIALRRGQSELYPDAYAKKVIPDVLPFRNKVSAHFAWATKNSHDNDAERLASIIPQLQLINGKFIMGGWHIHRRIGGKSSDSSEIKPWSITDVHDRLTARYWQPPSVESPAVAS